MKFFESADVLMILEPSGTIQLASSASRQYFGEVQLTGKQVFEVIRNPLFMSLMEEARKNLTPGVSELRLDYPEERYFSARVSPLSSPDKELAGFVVAVPMIIGAFSGFALLAGVVDLSIGSMVGFSSATFAALQFAQWDIWTAAVTPRRLHGLRTDQRAWRSSPSEPTRSRPPSAC